MEIGGEFIARHSTMSSDRKRPCISDQFNWEACMPSCGNWWKALKTSSPIWERKSRSVLTSKSLMHQIQDDSSYIYVSRIRSSDCPEGRPFCHCCGKSYGDGQRCRATGCHSCQCSPFPYVAFPSSCISLATYWLYSQTYSFMVSGSGLQTACPEMQGADRRNAGKSGKGFIAHFLTRVAGSASWDGQT